MAFSSAMRAGKAAALRRYVDLWARAQAWMETHPDLWAQIYYQKDQGLAAYMVFADRTLLEMAERRPATLDDLRAIHGVGERKIALYGEVFLDAIAQAAS